MNKSRPFFRKTDLIAVLMVLSVFCGTIIFYSVNHSSQSHPAYAQIRVNSRLYKTVDLKGVSSPYELVVDGNFPVILEISSQGVRFISSSCPDKLCIHSGLITENRSAACLPAGVSVSVKGENSPSVDGIVG